MEKRKFKNRREQMEDYARRMGWGPLTEEDKIALDDIVRMVTKPTKGMYISNRRKTIIR